MIEKAPGVKSDELEATGVIEWLQAVGGKVKKSDILDFLADKAVIINDVMKGEKKFYLEGSLMHPATGEVQSREDWLSDLDPDYLMDEGLSEEEALGRLIDVAGDEVQGDDFSDTEYGKYTVPGGKNYRELPLTLPGNDDKTSLPQASWSNPVKFASSRCTWPTIQSGPLLARRDRGRGDSQFLDGASAERRIPLQPLRPAQHPRPRPLR